MKLDFFANWYSENKAAMVNIDTLWFIGGALQSFLAKRTYSTIYNSMYCHLNVIDDLDQIIGPKEKLVNLLTKKKTIVVSVPFLSENVIVSSTNTIEQALIYIESVLKESFYNIRLLQIPDFKVELLQNDTTDFFQVIRDQIKTTKDIPSSRDPDSPLMRKLLAYLNS